MMSRVLDSAVVLGASTGTGAAITKHLAWRGMPVIGFHRGRHTADADAVERAGGADLVRMVQRDVGTSPQAVEEGICCTADRVRNGGIKVFVHSLSGAAVGDILTMTPAHIERTFATQTHSFLWWAQGLRKAKLLAPHATLIALTNPVATNYLTNSGVIGGAKAALEAYVRALAVELGREGHRVLGIRFGAVATPALDVVVPGALQAMQGVHQFISPAKRMQEAAEIGALVALLVEHDHATAALNGAIVDFTFGATLTLMDYAFSRPAGE